MIADFLSLVRRTGIVRDASRILTFQFLTLTCTLVSSILVARALGPLQKGMFDLYTLLLSMIVELGLLGLPAGLAYCAMTRREPIERVHGTGVTLLLVASTVLALMFLVLGRFVYGSFPELPQWVFYVVLLAAPAGFYMTIWGNLLIAQNRAVARQRFLVLFAAANLFLVLVLYGTDRLNFSTFLLCSGGLYILLSAFAFAYLKRRHGRLSFARATAIRSLHFGWPIFLGGIANFLHFKVDQLMINAWVGLEGLGFYALSVRWAEMLFLLDSAIVTAAFYRIGSSRAGESHAFSRDVMLIQFAVNLVAACVLGAFVVAFFEYLYGEEFVPSITPLLLLLPGIIVWSAMKPMSNYLSYVRGRGGVIGIFSAVGLLLNILLNYLLIYKADMGIDGAAVASSISYVLVGTMVAFDVMRQRRSVNVPN